MRRSNVFRYHHEVDVRLGKITEMTTNRLTQLQISVVALHQCTVGCRSMKIRMMHC